MKLPVNARTWTFAALSQLLAGCAVSLQGLVAEDGPGVHLQAPDGSTYRLVTVGPAAPVAHLEGHLVQLEGRRVFRTVTVEDWRVPEGLHGMSAWVGPLRPMGAQLGLEDRNSGGFYYLDTEAATALRAHLDKVVLVEGYVDGPHHVKVLYFRVLE